MQKKYDFKIIEKNKNIIFTQNQYSILDLRKNIDQKSFTIVLPPPNITGKLHLGHAWNNILQDIIIRRKKMLGFNVLFVPGMDHAGIATQNKIKQVLKEKGIVIQELSKDFFLQYASQWKEKYAEKIRQQWKLFGLYLNYSLEKFTLDTEVSEIVKQVFIFLYNKKLIYRDYRIINWDSKTHTVLSDVEVNYKDQNSSMYYLKYVFKDNPEEFLLVATTRPETIFVDQALMVHPDDVRYQKFIGMEVFIPDTQIVIPIISDVCVKPNFGSGVVKVTPAHDANDFRVGKKYKLPIISCIDIDGNMNELTGEYYKMSFLECRQKLSLVLKKKGFLVKTESYSCSVGYSSISDTIIESRPSLQWFFRTKELAQNVLLKHKISFYPFRYRKYFMNWLNNLQDWCISRQLWWGHSIPAWYKKQEIKVQVKNPGNGWQPDKDVLDTWFSSSLWPLISLGWPNVNNFLFKKFFPVDVLVTGYDILNFWVSRMCLQSYCLTQKDPFKVVLLHGLIRDHAGQKMSKSKGNGLDPICIIEKYGTDTLRWFLTMNSSPGMDLYYNESKVISSWNFLNKIWNISRFFILNFHFFTDNFDQTQLLFPEKVLLHQFSRLLTEIDILCEKYEFNEVGKLLYKFIWEDFANWGLEFCKNNIKLENTQKFLIYIFINVLKLLHPFIPFLTDYIYQELKQLGSIIDSQWPYIKYSDLHSLNDFQILKKLIIQMRKFRNEYQLKDFPKFKIEFELPLAIQKKILPFTNILKKFFQIDELFFRQKVISNIKILLFIEKNVGVYIDQEIFQLITSQKEYQNLFDQKEKIKKELARSESILKNENFLKKACATKISQEKEKYQNYLSQYKKLMKIFEKK